MFEKAAADGRVIVSADTDFAEMLALRAGTSPSLILFRRARPRLPQRQAVLLKSNLPEIEQAIRQGAVVVSEETRIRVRRLPVGQAP